MQRIGLAADRDARVAVDLQQEANVEMMVRRLGCAAGIKMDVEIENLIADRTDGRDAGLLACFADRDREHVGIGVAVAAELNPFVQLAVVRQQDAPARGIEQPSRAGDMAGMQRGIKAVGVLVHECFHGPPLRVIGRIQGDVSGQLGEQIGSVHVPQTLS